jgi:hypothetical protein
MLGFAGLMLFLGGLVGAIVALNYDTWVQGLSINSVGILQLSATLGMLVVGAVGGFLLFRGMGKAKRRGTAAQ